MACLTCFRRPNQTGLFKMRFIVFLLQNNVYMSLFEARRPVLFCLFVRLFLFSFLFVSLLLGFLELFCFLNAMVSLNIITFIHSFIYSFIHSSIQFILKSYNYYPYHKTL